MEPFVGQILILLGIVNYSTFTRGSSGSGGSLQETLTELSSKCGRHINYEII